MQDDIEILLQVIVWNSFCSVLPHECLKRVDVCVCVCVCLCVCLRVVCVCQFIRVYKYIYIYMHIYVYSHLHDRIYVHIQNFGEQKQQHKTAMEEYALLIARVSAISAISTNSTPEGRASQGTMLVRMCAT